MRSGDALATAVGGVQQFVGRLAAGFTTEYAAVTGIDEGVVAASSQLLSGVILVESLAPQAVGLGFEAYRLAGTADTAAGAGHHLYQVDLGLAFLHLPGQALGIGDTLDYRNTNFFSPDLNGCGLYACFATEWFKIDRHRPAGSKIGARGWGRCTCVGELARVVAVIFDCGAAVTAGQVAQHRFAYTARVAKDDSGARAEAHRQVEGVGFEVGKTDSRLLNHAAELGGGKHVVYQWLAVAAQLLALRFILLGSTRHDGNHLHLLRIYVELLGNSTLGKRADHGLRRHAAGEVGKQIREGLLGELYPGRAAGGKHRKVFAGLAPVSEFVCLLYHGKVGAEAGIVDRIEAEHAEGARGFAGDRLARRQVEHLAQGHAHSRCNLGHYIGIFTGES